MRDSRFLPRIAPDELGHEHSEDAVTWNVLRFFEYRACLSPAIRTICPCTDSEPLTVF
jgi:hypothetical protein